MTLIGNILACLGAAAVVVAFFLPWIVSRTIATLGPLADFGLGMVRPELTIIVDEIRKLTELTGADLVIRLDIIPVSAKALTLLPLVLALLTLIVVVACLISTSRLVVARVAVAILCFIGAAILMISLSVIKRLGMGDNVIVNTIAGLLGLAAGPGYWISLAGTFLMAIGLAVGSFGSRSTDSSDDDWALTTSSSEW